MKIHEKLRDKRRQRNMSQKKLAEKIGYTQAQVSKMEKGGDVSFEFLQKVARELDFEIVANDKEKIKNKGA